MAWARPRRIATDLHRESRSGHSFSRVFHQQRQQAVLHWSQPDRLAVQYHHLLAKMHKQVFITIELLVQRRQKHTQSAAILHPYVRNRDRIVY